MAIYYPAGHPLGCIWEPQAPIFDRKEGVYIAPIAPKESLRRGSTILRARETFLRTERANPRLDLAFSVLFRDEVGEKSQLANRGKKVMKAKDRFDSSAFQ